MDRLQHELVERRKLISLEDQRSLMLAAAMIPAPKFLAFAAMIGYRLGGISGAVGSSISIMLPGTILVLAACILTVIASGNPALATIQHYVGLGVVGLLTGNALRMFVGDGVRPYSVPVRFGNQPGNTALCDRIQRPSYHCGLCRTCGGFVTDPRK